MPPTKDKDKLYLSRKIAADYMRERGRIGVTLDELSAHMSNVYGYKISNKITGRLLTAFKSKGQAVGTKMKRGSTSGELAQVVVLREFSNGEFDLRERKSGLRQYERGEQGC